MKSLWTGHLTIYCAHSDVKHIDISPGINQNPGATMTAKDTARIIRKSVFIYFVLTRGIGELGPQYTSPCRESSTVELAAF